MDMYIQPLREAMFQLPRPVVPKSAGIRSRSSPDVTKTELAGMWV